jgi:glutamine---fructose-6-phosphate transaminase (isomerizing)
MSKYLNDIQNQPQNWLKCLEHNFSPEGKSDLKRAAILIKKSKRLIISGIGASYCAGIAIETLFKKSGINVVLEDSSELMHPFYAKKGDVLLLLSRSGKSVELVKLLHLAKDKNLPVLCICNDAESPLAKGSDVNLRMNVAFDHGISVATYTAIILVGILLVEIFENPLSPTFERNSFASILSIKDWLFNLQDNNAIRDWILVENSYYFLARNRDRSASNAATLLLEEGAKMPATVKNTGSFRHGPQEVISSKINLMIWLEAKSPSYAYDLALCKDLVTQGVRVFVIGDAGVSVTKNRSINLPDAALPFQLLAIQIPAQLAAYHLSLRRGEDADTFKFCNYIVDKEGGL